MALLALVGWLFATSWRPAPADYPVQGVDVGEAQGAIDWWAVKKSGAAFAYIRVTEGAGQADSAFADNWRGAAEAGFRRGALHVYSLCQPGAAQADNFVKLVPRSDDQLPTAVAIEFGGDCDRPARDAVVAELTRFLAAIETHLGEHAMLRIGKTVEAHYRLSHAFPRVLWSRQAFFSPDYSARPW
ncbi:MAG: glycosyl hydrolase, partial [Sphingomonadales bacterium]